MKVCIRWRLLLICLPLIFFLPLSFSVFLLHKKSNIEILKKHGNKFDHLILGTATGQGLPNCLQCEGVKALNKIHFQIPAFSDTISFVTVFTIYNTSPSAHSDDRLSNVVTVGSISYSKTERSMAILNVFINFIQKSMPQSNVIILTDPASELSIHRNRVNVLLIQGEYLQES